MSSLKELLDEGVTAMKIWPFDLAAEANDGLDVSAERGQPKRPWNPGKKSPPQSIATRSRSWSSFIG